MGMEEKNGMMMDLMSHYYMNNNNNNNERPILYPSISPPQPHDHLHYAMVMLGGGSSSGGGGGMMFGSDSTNGLGSTNSGDHYSGGGNYNNNNNNNHGEINNGGGSCGNGRWPKEETLVLLDIRLRLNSKFKDATQKSPLWDEVSRIMCVEHGYRRTGKNCSEKFENLYKYYKKIKEGKAGRQDKKHYRFFRQLEAIYGETSARITRDPNLPSSNTNDHNPYGFNQPSCDFQNRERKVEKKHWKTKITDFIETKMKTIMEKQDAWMEKMMNTIDQKEKERIFKEEQWRNEEITKLETKKKFHLNERARMVSRDSALMEALHKLTSSTHETNNNKASTSYKYCNINDQNQNWGENEITQLIQLRSSMETRFGSQGGRMDQELLIWEEIALTMSCLGYNRNALSCKDKWDQINVLLRTKKRKENTRLLCSNMYTDRDNYCYMYNQEGLRSCVAQNDSENSGGGCKVLMSTTNDPEIMWNNCFGNMKMTKGEKPFAWPYY